MMGTLALCPSYELRRRIAVPCLRRRSGAVLAYRAACDFRGFGVGLWHGKSVAYHYQFNAIHKQALRIPVIRNRLLRFPAGGSKGTGPVAPCPSSESGPITAQADADKMPHSDSAE